MGVYFVFIVVFFRFFDGEIEVYSTVRICLRLRGRTRDWNLDFKIYIFCFRFVVNDGFCGLEGVRVRVSLFWV